MHSRNRSTRLLDRPTAGWGPATLDTEIPVDEELSGHEILEISLHLTRGRSAG